MTAPHELVIDVTALDIRLGRAHDACECPVARAAARFLGLALDDHDVAVDVSGIQVRHHGSRWTYYAIPDQAAEFIQQFDDSGEVAPLTFTATWEGV